MDVIAIVFSQSPTQESDEVNPGFIMDYDAQGNIVGMEILDASQRMENPNVVEYMVSQPPYKQAG